VHREPGGGQPWCDRAEQVVQLFLGERDDIGHGLVEEPPQRLLAEARRLRLDLNRVWILKHGETRRW